MLELCLLLITIVLMVVTTLVNALIFDAIISPIRVISDIIKLPQEEKFAKLQNLLQKFIVVSKNVQKFADKLEEEQKVEADQKNLGTFSEWEKLLSNVSDLNGLEFDPHTEIDFEKYILKVLEGKKLRFTDKKSSRVCYFQMLPREIKEREETKSPISPGIILSDTFPLPLKWKLKLQVGPIVNGMSFNEIRDLVDFLWNHYKIGPPKLYSGTIIHK